MKQKDAWVNSLVSFSLLVSGVRLADKLNQINYCVPIETRTATQNGVDMISTRLVCAMPGYYIAPSGEMFAIDTQKN